MVRFVVHLLVTFLADCDLEIRLNTISSAKGAQDFSLAIARLTGFLDCFAQLGRQKLSFALSTVFFELESDLLAINLVVEEVGSFERPLSEVERVAYLTAQLGIVV